MCLLELATLQDRIPVLVPEPITEDAAPWWDGGDQGIDATDAHSSMPGEGVGAATHTTADIGSAALTPQTPEYRPLAFGQTRHTTMLLCPNMAWPVLVTCAGCGEELRLDAVGYRQAVNRLVAQGWHYAARPHGTARCPDCRTDSGGRRDSRGAALRSPVRSAARDMPRTAR